MIRRATGLISSNRKGVYQLIKSPVEGQASGIEGTRCSTVLRKLCPHLSRLHHWFRCWMVSFLVVSQVPKTYLAHSPTSCGGLILMFTPLQTQGKAHLIVQEKASELTLRHLVRVAHPTPRQPQGLRNPLLSPQQAHPSQSLRTPRGRRRSPKGRTGVSHLLGGDIKCEEETQCNKGRVVANAWQLSVLSKGEEEEVGKEKRKRSLPGLAACFCGQPDTTAQLMSQRPSKGIPGHGFPAGRQAQGWEASHQVWPCLAAFRLDNGQAMTQASNCYLWPPVSLIPSSQEGLVQGRLRSHPRAA
nr:uncharacterized protein LOC100712612 isoform X2 [Cavia porcellus]